MTAGVLTTQEAILRVPRHDAGGLEHDRVRFGRVEVPGEHALGRVSRHGLGRDPHIAAPVAEDTEAASGIVMPATAIPFAVRYQRASKAQSEVNNASAL